MASVRDWAVTRLRDLQFEGDADALAAYVDALAENNAVHENGDLAKLKAEAYAELSFFLGPDGTQSFVADLVAHLARTRPCNDKTPAPSPPAPPAPSTTPQTPAPASRERATSDRSRSRRDRERRERESEREKDRSRERERESRSAPRAPRGREQDRPSVLDRLRERTPETRERITGPRHGAPTDLRSQLSRRRGTSSPPGPQKRPRDERASVSQKQGRFDKRIPHLPLGVPPPPPHPGMHYPIPPPQMMMAMRNAAAADPAMLAQMLAATANTAPPTRGRGSMPRGRGSRGGRSDRGGHVPANGHRGSATLMVKHVPEDKLNFGDLNNYFQKFGTLSNIRLMPPGRALLEFASRSQAQAAMSSVDAVFNNRHIKLSWTRDGDMNETSGSRKRGGSISSIKESEHSTANDSMSVVVEDPEAELQRKRREIQAARAAEQKKKEEERVKREAAIADQKDLFKQLESGNCSLDQKKQILKRLQAINEVVSDVNKPKTRPPAPTEEKPWKRQRTIAKHKSYSLDNRPKVVRIMGAKSDISADAAAAIFRDTDRAETHNGAWILHFSSRAAAESALRAVNVLKRGFGPASKAEIIKFSPTAPTFVPSANAPQPSPVAQPQSLPGAQ